MISLCRAATLPSHSMSPAVLPSNLSGANWSRLTRLTTAAIGPWQTTSTAIVRIDAGADLLDAALRLGESVLAIAQAQSCSTRPVRGHSSSMALCRCWRWICHAGRIGLFGRSLDAWR